MVPASPRRHIERLRQLLASVSALRSSALELESEQSAAIAATAPENRASARNLLHYLALRHVDLRELQLELAEFGLSSLGRAESHVLSNLEAVRDVLAQLVGEPAAGEGLHAVSLREAGRLLERHTATLLGPAPKQREVRILVTLPSEAATDATLARQLLAEGANAVRINGAHDGPAAWEAMARHVRAASEASETPCRILFDLPGPKLRTGVVEPGPQVLRWKPRRNAAGAVIAPARICLRTGEPDPVADAGADAVLRVSPWFLSRLAPDTRITLRDLRGKKREITVTNCDLHRAVGTCEESTYVGPSTELKASCAGEKAVEALGPLPAVEQEIPVRAGDRVLLHGRELSRLPMFNDRGEAISPAEIACTIPAVVAALQPGERVLFDDGKIAAVVEHPAPEGAWLRITHTPGPLGKIGTSKGINLPDSKIPIQGLQPEDLAALDFAAMHADIVGLSFVKSPEDVDSLREELRRRGASGVAIVLKIETQEAFAQLPRLLLAALRSYPVGIMIARGDLAVECGFERLAELQEEILWLCQAAHVPSIWATQVLESLAKTGLPSRAEITDAAMGERAECVMLNKGPHAAEAVRALSDILTRMRQHQDKKTPMLRRLRVTESLFAHGADR